MPRKPYLGVAYLLGVTAISTLLSLCLWRNIVACSTGILDLGIFSLLLFVTYHVVLEIVNVIAANVGRPHRLQRLDAYPENMAPNTLVAISEMLVDETSVGRMMANIKKNYSDNSATHIYYCLLTDWADSNTSVSESDLQLLSSLRRKLDELNVESGRKVFYLLHRYRSWNAQEEIWMGYERKRGKLEALNNLIMTGECKFGEVLGDVERLRSIQYVIPLDSDTQMPPGSADRLVRILAHPDNAAELDDEGRVVSGYSILQPYILASSAKPKSLFQLYGQLDMGTKQSAARFEISQELFSQGAYYGKGVYLVRAFSMALAERVPVNSVLSHDVLEGCFARTAFVCDIFFIENVPITYRAHIRRKQRWIRGDWQNSRWLFSQVPTFAGTRRGDLSWFSRLQIWENIRRSLFTVALIALYAYLRLIEQSKVASYLVAAVLLIPITASTLIFVIQRSAVSLTATLSKCLLTLSFFPFEAWVSLSSVVRAVYRMNFRHKGLLEWQAFDVTNEMSNERLSRYIHDMWIAPFTAGLLLAFLLYASQPNTLDICLCGLWVASPVLAWFVSRPTGSNKIVR